MYFTLCIWHLPDDVWCGQPKHVAVCNTRLLYQK